MKINKTNFMGLKLIKGKIFYDTRGFFKEVFKKKNIKSHNPIFWCICQNQKKMF